MMTRYCIPPATIILVTMFCSAFAQPASLPSASLPSTSLPSAPLQSAPTTEPFIQLTPPPAPAPRINGAKIFGVRPKSPLLFTIAATGERPMSFTADSLPPGVQLDSATGQFSGSIDKPGEYHLVLTATNRLGSAHRPFKIVCGPTLSLTPQMGWNDWYTWTNKVADKTIRAGANAMVANGMINVGYQYVSIDDCWAVSTDSTDPRRRGEARDPAGHINPNSYFPDMKALTDYIHSKGLKAGIYSSPGPMTCAHYTGSYQHEADDARQFADWGFDLLKYDLCSYKRLVLKDPTNLPGMKKPYQLMSGLLVQQQRDIVLNMCQYGLDDAWTWAKSVGGQSWRTAGDIGSSRGPGIAAKMYRDGFDLYAEKHLDQYGGPGGWNDPDYLAIGIVGNAPSPMTPNEQYTQMSFWSIVAAPLFFSGDISKTDDFALGILCNADVIDVNQDPLGKPGHRVSKDGDKEVWSRDMEDGSKAVGLFNRGEEPTTVTANWSDLGLSGSQPIRDLWRQKDLPAADTQFAAMVARHGVVLVRIGQIDR